MDMVKAKNSIYISIGMAFFYSLLFIFIMSKCAKPLTFCVVGTIELGLLGLAYITYLDWESMTK